MKPIPIGVRLSKGVDEAMSLESQSEWFHWMSGNGLETVDVSALTPQVKQAADRAGLRIATFETGDVRPLFSRNEEKRRKAVEFIIRELNQGAELGVKICYMCLRFEEASMPKKESFALFKEVFPFLTEAAEKAGVKIVLEGFPGRAPHYSVLGSTPEMLRAMFEAVPSPALGVNYDPSHLYRLGIDYLRFLREFIERVAHVHAKDCVINEEDVYLYGRGMPSAFTEPVRYSEGAWRYTIVGEGSINWAAVAFELDKSGYTGAVSVELEDHRYTASLENKREGILKSLQFLRRYF